MKPILKGPAAFEGDDSIPTLAFSLLVRACQEILFLPAGLAGVRCTLVWGGIGFSGVVLLSLRRWLLVWGLLDLGGLEFV